MSAVDISMIKFDDKGLVPAVVQEENGQVLMLAYMNKESLEKTIETGYTWYYSRSRQRLWNKGEESGNKQKVKEISYDCDGDTLLIKRSLSYGHVYLLQRPQAGGGEGKRSGGCRAGAGDFTGYGAQ